MLTLRTATDPTTDTDQLRRWRCGRIRMQGGRLVGIEHRLTPSKASIARVWWQAKYGRMEDDICCLDYHQPLGMPAFLTLDYIRSGKKAGYKSAFGAIEILGEIARLRGTLAIVAHVSNGSISDRLLRRCGWQPHLTDWPGRHWIRRYYDGYPEVNLRRFVQETS